MKVGLVLEGGAMRGLYAAGVLDVFLDNHIKVDGIIGVSAGVLFGVNYASHQRGRSIRYNKKYVKDKRYMGLHSLMTTGNIINKDFAYYELPTKLDIFDEQAFEKSNIDFWATVTNIETGKPEYIKLENVIEQMEVLRATSAMPFVSKIVSFNGKKYLDGGIADSIPIEKCQELGFDKIIAILTRPLGYTKKKANLSILRKKYKEYPNLIEAIENRYLNYNSSLKTVLDLEKKKEIFVIRPSRTIKIKRIEKNEEKLQEMYDLGLEDSKACMQELADYLKK